MNNEIYLDLNNNSNNVLDSNRFSRNVPFSITQDRNDRFEDSLAMKKNEEIQEIRINNNNSNNNNNNNSSSSNTTNIFDCESSNYRLDCIIPLRRNILTNLSRMNSAMNFNRKYRPEQFDRKIQHSNHSKIEQSIDLINDHHHHHHHLLIWFIIMFGLIIILIVLSSMCLTRNVQYKNLCLTEVCISEAAKIINSIDKTVDPCDDFYQFVCGQWLEKTIIPEHKPMENKFDELHDTLHRQIRTMLERSENISEASFIKNLKLFYNSCMNVSEIDRRGAEPLIKILDQLGGWPILDGESKWSDLKEKQWSLVEMHRKLNDLGVIEDMIIPLFISIDEKNNSKNIVTIKEPSFGLMNREFMTKDDDDTAIKSYFGLMLYTLQLLMEQKQQQQQQQQQQKQQKQSLQNNPQTFRRRNPMEFTFEMNDIDLEPKLIDEMREILNFEKMLANNSITKEERSNITRLYNEMTIEQLERISPNVEWLQLINIFTESIQLTLTNESKIVVTDLNYVKFLSDIMPSTSKRLITNYIVWRVIKSKIGILDSTWRRLKQTYNSVNMGHPRIESRWLQCVSHTYASLGTALSNIYIKNHFTLKGKNKIDEIVDKIRAELNTTINYATWMDSRTKQSALDKLASMNFRIGYPDELLDDDLISKYYENLTLTENYFENVIALHKFFVESSFKSLKEINYRNDWRKYTDVIDVNAYYYHQENSFILNAGILQDRFFNPDRPNYLNYGSIGEIIGHEITHGFDSIGKQYDKTGRLRNWWDPKTDELYQKKASCMVDQYNQYSFDQIAMHLNGDNTKDENIADNIGVALAYRAYVRAYHSFWSDTEQYLPGLSYNPRQLFWISYGLENCEKMTDEMLKITLQLDTHSPGKYRLNGVVSNSRSFASDFGCPTASPMNPETKCQVW